MIPANNLFNSVKPAKELHPTVNQDHISKLILLNDDVNTFEFVIENLMNVCDFDAVQAEQLTLLVHFKGKAVLKHGDELKLMPMFIQLSNNGLSAQIHK
jgi:ATP-dependent Clp protease adaptor protein ClpS